MKFWIILTTIILMFATTGCLQKSRYAPPPSDEKKITLSEEELDQERIRRAFLKLRPQDQKERIAAEMLRGENY